MFISQAPVHLVHAVSHQVRWSSEVAIAMMVRGFPAVLARTTEAGSLLATWQVVGVNRSSVQRLSRNLFHWQQATRSHRLDL